MTLWTLLLPEFVKFMLENSKTNTRAKNCNLGRLCIQGTSVCTIAMTCQLFGGNNIVHASVIKNQRTVVSKFLIYFSENLSLAFLKC